MRKSTALFLAFTCLLFAGCAEKQDKAVTCEQVITAYEGAGYEIFHKETTTEDRDSVCYVKATDPQTQEYIYFHFFETAEEAEAYGETRQYNVLIWLFSLICGDPTWMTTKVYNNIEIEYDRAYLYEPFKELT